MKTFFSFHQFLVVKIGHLRTCGHVETKTKTISLSSRPRPQKIGLETYITGLTTTPPADGLVYWCLSGDSIKRVNTRTYGTIEWQCAYYTPHRKEDATKCWIHISLSGKVSVGILQIDQDQSPNEVFCVGLSQAFCLVTSLQ